MPARFMIVQDHRIGRLDKELRKERKRKEEQTTMARLLIAQFRDGKDKTIPTSEVRVLRPEPRNGVLRT